MTQRLVRPTVESAIACLRLDAAEGARQGSLGDGAAAAGAGAGGGGGDGGGGGGTNGGGNTTTPGFEPRTSTTPRARIGLVPPRTATTPFAADDGTPRTPSGQIGGYQARRRRRPPPPLTRPGFEPRTAGFAPRTSRRRFASRWTDSGFQTRFASRRRCSWRRLRRTRRSRRWRPRRRRRSRPSWTRPREGTDAPVERGGRLILTRRLEKKTRLLRGKPDARHYPTNLGTHARVRAIARVDLNPPPGS